MASKRSGVSSLLKFMRALCRIIETNRSTIIARVPGPSQAAVTTALDSILAACAVIELIDWVDV